MLVLPGERIPADAVVLDGVGNVDESMITGESMPVEKLPGHAVTGATVNALSPLVVRVARTGRDTTLAHIMQLVERA